MNHLDRDTLLTLLFDVGTKAEIVLENHERLMTVACSTGAVFESEGIHL
jgi:uncharacterized 2Fe-2S/4Fe-4S cluster protein (DUF4445 family)